MVAARYDCILVTSVDPNNPMFAARRISLWFAVTFDADHGEIHLADDTIRVLERQWKVSINAVPDIASLSLHAHPWRDGHQNRRLDDFCCERAIGSPEPHPGCTQQHQRGSPRHTAQANGRCRRASHLAAGGCKLTAGVARSASLETSKYCRCEKPNKLATTLLGNDCTSTF